jgi:hypothetical protein
MSANPSTMYHGFFCGSVQRPPLVAVGPVLLLWVVISLSGYLASVGHVRKFGVEAHRHKAVLIIGGILRRTSGATNVLGACCR